VAVNQRWRDGIEFTLVIVLWSLYVITESYAREPIQWRNLWPW
jgi:hypothetical protein